jgi:kynurenine formamidase
MTRRVQQLVLLHPFLASCKHLFLDMKFLRHLLFIVSLTTALAVSLPSAEPVGVEENPSPELAGPWWPSTWGPGDQLGAANLLEPTVVVGAARHIKKGEVVDLAHPLDMNQPDSFHNRHFSLISAGSPSGGPVGANKYMYNEEWIAGEITGIGTQFDALSHLGRQLGDTGNNATIYYYNGFRHSDIATRSGFKKLGIENVPPVFTTGILLDLPKLAGSALKGGTVITKKMLLSALARQGMSEGSISQGSVVLIRQGRDIMWAKDPLQYSKTSAGLNREAAEWLISKKIFAVGSDSIAMEPIPPVNDRLAEIHAIFLMENGVYMFENLNLKRLSDAAVYRFAFVFGAIPIVGAQGSAARPFAVY